MPSGLELYQKDTPAKAFSWEYCEIFNSSYLEEHLRMPGSEARESLPNTVHLGTFLNNTKELFLFLLS